MALQNMSDQLMHELGRQIVHGEILPNSALPKVEVLSEMKGVSRTVVREALKGLTARRLVESTTKVGTVVCARSSWQWWDPDVLTWATEAKNNQQFLHQLTEIRLAIEPAAVELAAKNATEHDIEVIQERYKELERSIGDDSEWVNADFEFHKSILVASHNELMLSLVQTLRMALERSRHTTIELIKKHPSPAYNEPLEEVLARHKAVMEAVCNRDGAIARQKIQELLNRVAELIKVVQT